MITKKNQIVNVKIDRISYLFILTGLFFYDIIASFYKLGEYKMKKIKLTNYQNVAYWWVKALKRNCNELAAKEELNIREEQFLDMFGELDSQEWRWE